MIFDLFITFLLVFLNGFFVAAEFALVKVRSSQLELSAKAGNRAAILAKHIVLHLDGYLAATQLGITLASLGLGWIGEPVVSKIIISMMDMVGLNINPELAHQIALPISFALITVLHIVFGELAPKSLAIQRSKETTLTVAYPMQVFFWVFRPFIWVLNGIANLLLSSIGIAPVHGSEVHSSDELKYLVMQGRDSGTIEESDYDIIKNAFDFSERTARQVMVPRTQISSANLNGFNENELARIIDEGYSRIPCHEGGIDNVIGVVYLKDILLKMRSSGPVNLRDIMRPILTVPATVRIGKLLKDFQVKHQQIALVVDEYGGTEGIITMEDILEELVGEIQDEYDNEIPALDKLGDNIYQLGGSVSLHDLNRALPHPIGENSEYETLAGCLIDHFGRIPNNNERINFDDFEFTVLKKSRNSIVLVKMVDQRG
jgi:CBS domain containing-hemolysin-like protein